MRWSLFLFCTCLGCSHTPPKVDEPPPALDGSPRPVVAAGPTPIAPAGVDLVAGGGDAPDGSTARGVKLIEPFAVAMDRSGTLFVAEMTGHRVRRIDAVTGIVTTIAGTGIKGPSGDGGPAVRAALDGPHHLAVRPGTDELYVADTWNHRVRRIDPATGVLTSVAGTGVKGFSGDGGPATAAQFGGIYSVAFDVTGATMVIADLDNRRVRAVDMSSGVVTTVAGDGTRGIPPDGAESRRAPLVDPRAAALDAAGNLYIVERGGHAVRVVEPSGRIRTVAGTGKAGPGADDGAALAVTFNGPKHVWIDRHDDVLIADSENHVIRKLVVREQRVVRLAGTGRRGAGAPGPDPRAIALSRPHGVYVGPDGAIFVSDSDNGRILRLPR